jgi:hypothetical protein
MTLREALIRLPAEVVEAGVAHLAYAFRAAPCLANLGLHVDWTIPQCLWQASDAAGSSPAARLTPSREGSQLGFLDLAGLFRATFSVVFKREGDLVARKERPGCLPPRGQSKYILRAVHGRDEAETLGRR